MATAWFDERAPDVLYLARGAHRPLWLGRGLSEFVFASTKHALEIVERYAQIKLRKQEVREGTFVAVCEGEIVRQERFRPDHDFVDEPLPAVRAPGESEACLSALAALAAA
jgi:hypothetical protein